MDSMVNNKHYKKFVFQMRYYSPPENERLVDILLNSTYGYNFQHVQVH